MRANCLPGSVNCVPDRIYAAGLLALYELNRIELIKEAFLWS